jgi:hypothetical protein
MAIVNRSLRAPVMRSQVQRFPVDVHDIYEDARASMTSSPRRRWPMALLTTTAAIALGAAVGWMLVPELPGPAQRPAVTFDRSASATDRKAHPTDTASPAGVAVPLTAPAADSSTTWPVILHRAGDGRFYADLGLDGHVLNVEADPRRAATRLTLADLPAGAVPTADAWEATTVVLEHHRLPATRFTLAREPEATAVLGADLLARHFVVEEQRDRLRLVPRRAAE